MTSREELLDVARRVAGAATAGEEVEAYVIRSQETDVKVHAGAVESLTVAGVEGIGVRVVRDGRQGYAYAGSLDAEVIAETLAEARDNVAFAEPDEHAGLVRPEEIGEIAAVELELWRDDVLRVPTEQKVALALELERMTAAADERLRGVESVDYGDGAVEAAIASSLGVEAAARRTVASVSAFALAGEGDQTQTGYGFSAARAFGELDPEVAARDAAARATSLLGASQPAGRRLPVVLDPLVTRSVLALIGGALGGEAVLKGRSMFAGRVGESVASPVVSLVEDPTLPEAFGASTHDGEGVPTRRIELVRDGVLQGFLHNAWTARRAGARTTGSAVRGYASAPGVGARALHLRPGTRTPEEIVASLPEGLYVQSVSGLHSGTSSVSGDFSVGAEGHLIRDGAKAEPVREVTIASTLPRILLDIAEVGADLTWLPGGGAGVTLLVGDMTMSGR